MKNFNLLFLFVCTVHSLAHGDLLQAPKGYRYALVTVLPGEEEITPGQAALFQEAQGWIQDALPVVVGSLKSLLLTSQVQSSARSVFVKTSDEIKSMIAPKLADMREKLPQDYKYINSYLIPWPEDKVASAGVTSAAGFPVVVLRRSDQKTMESIFAQVNTSVLTSLSAQYKNDDHFHFVAAAFKLRLQKQISIFTMQVYGGLKSGKDKFEDNGPEVNISEIVIPQTEVLSNGHVPYAPTVLLTLRDRLSAGAPEMNLDFGTYGGLARDAATADGFSAEGELQIFRNPFSAAKDADCHLKEATPVLVGVLGPHASGIGVIDELMQGSPVEFRIFKVDIDADAGRIAKMDVRTRLGPFSCLSRENIGEKFKGKANEAIQKLMDSLYKQNNLTDQLMNRLYKKKSS